MILGKSESTKKTTDEKEDEADGRPQKDVRRHYAKIKDERRESWRVKS